ncbi:DNA repair protein [Talaromyces pinophilus]|uniref:DNA repair protein rad9 n=1 Tax=Talaromyces pinophilus TaxID=128442 RepID=A0A6V8HA62_TALPI|nr:DNA repair protein [Talaromyces pinophilus]
MPNLSFSLKPSALLQLHDALVCLSKFNESVSIEAEYDLLRLSTLNTAKTAYASFVLDSGKFFSKYSFSARGGQQSSSGQRYVDKFACQMYLKALLSVFKGRAGESRDKQTAVERCDIELHDSPDEAECVVKSYKLTYEPVSVQHALFDQARVQNQWIIQAKILREIIDHFSPTAEQLDIYPDAGKAIFTSFTNKISDGKEILKQPVHTSVAIDKKDFEEFTVKDGLHVAINVKDFKAAVIHADTMKTSITARYTRPCRPLQLAYVSEDGIDSEFTLMTRGDIDEADNDDDASRPVSQLSARPAARRVAAPEPATIPSASAASAASSAARSAMPPPSSRPAITSRKPELMSSAASRAALADIHDSLFVPADDDRQWDEQAYDEADDQDILGWDSNIEPGAYHEGRPKPLTDDYPTLSAERQQTRSDAETAIPPTQPISQIRNLGLFD